ncbi:hypothetical protein V8C42DRAFT_306176 [Trichoderma barbatum]
MRLCFLLELHTTCMTLRLNVRYTVGWTTENKIGTLPKKMMIHGSLFEVCLFKSPWYLTAECCCVSIWCVFPCGG